MAYRKANPDKVAYASTGNGGSMHLTTELFAMQTGTTLRHVAYKGSTPALNDLMGGHVQVMFDNVPSAAPLAAAGKLRALAVTGANGPNSYPTSLQWPRQRFLASSRCLGLPSMRRPTHRVRS